jgi:hypothetical protein
VTRTQLQNLIDIAWANGRITTADALAAAASMRDPAQSTANILASVNAALNAQAIVMGTTKAAVDAELAAALGLSTTL